MKCKREVSDSSGDSKSQKKKTTKIKDSPTKNVRGDYDVRRGDSLQGTEVSSIRESYFESEEEQNPVTSEKHREEISVVEFSNSNASPRQPVKSIFNIEDLSPDDEIYTLQYPQSCNKQDFCNKHMDFIKHKTSVTSKGEVFELQLLNSDKKFITLAVPGDTLGGSLIKLPLKGHIVIQKAVDISIIEPMDDNCDKETVKFPDDVKIRHPLLGVDWKAQINLADAAFSKFKKKHKKRKKEKIEGEDNIEIKKIKEESSESEISTPKKKRKKYDL